MTPIRHYLQKSFGQNERNYSSIYLQNKRRPLQVNDGYYRLLALVFVGHGIVGVMAIVSWWGNPSAWQINPFGNGFLQKGKGLKRTGMEIKHFPNLEKRSNRRPQKRVSSKTN